MFQPTAKRGFTIESLVAKDGGTGGGTGGGGAGSHPLAAAASEEPLRPTALNYPHPGAAEAAFVSGFPAAAAAAAAQQALRPLDTVMPVSWENGPIRVERAAGCTRRRGCGGNPPSWRGWIRALYPEALWLALGSFVLRGCTPLPPRLSSLGALRDVPHLRWR